MICYSDLELETVFIQNSDPKHSLKDNGLHLKTCSFCRERYEDLTEFYIQFNQYSINKPSQRELLTASGIGESDKPSKIIAYPLPVLYPDTAEISGPHFLAAGTTIPDQKPDYNLLGVMSTADKKVLIRFLRPFGTQLTTLYLISDSPEMCSYVPVLILPQQKQYISDDAGKIDIEIDTRLNINDMQVELMKPQIRYLFHPGELEQLKSSKSLSCDLDLNREFTGTIQFKIDSGNNISTRLNWSAKDKLISTQMMLIQSNKQPELLEIENDKAVFKNYRAEDLLEFRIFT